MTPHTIEPLAQISPHSLHRVIRQSLGPSRLQLAGNSHRTEQTGQLQMQNLGGLALIELRYGCSAQVQVPANEHQNDYFLQIVLDGVGSWQRSDSLLQLGAGEMAILNPSTPLVISYDALCRKQIIRIPGSLLRQQALRLGYQIPPEGLRFAWEKHSVSDRQALIHLINSLTAAVTASSAPHLADHFGSILTSLLLDHFSHNLTRFHSLQPGQHPCVERVRQQVLLSPQQKHSLEQIAALCQVSVKTLYNIFERELSMSPSAYINQIRLELVHQSLQQNRNIRNVTEAALQFGFTNLGRFSQQYKAFFQELPSHTLRRASQL